MAEWWESILRNGGVVGDSVLRLTGVNNGRGDSKPTRRENVRLRSSVMSKTTESDKSTGRHISSLRSIESDLTLSTSGRPTQCDSLRELSRKRCSLRFWRRHKRWGFTLLINHSISQTLIVQIIRVICIASILFIIMRNHADTIFQCFCFTPSLLVIILLSVLAFVLTEVK